jgi:hypothetical protein
VTEPGRAADQATGTWGIGISRIRRPSPIGHATSLRGVRRTHPC